MRSFDFVSKKCFHGRRRKGNNTKSVTSAARVGTRNRPIRLAPRERPKYRQDLSRRAGHQTLGNRARRATSVQNSEFPHKYAQRSAGPPKKEKSEKPPAPSREARRQRAAHTKTRDFRTIVHNSAQKIQPAPSRRARRKRGGPMPSLLSPISWRLPVSWPSSGNPARPRRSGSKPSSVSARPSTWLSKP